MVSNMANKTENIINVMDRIGLTTACIVDLLNNNQNIKRYCKYKSKTPLSKVGKLGNVTVKQPDIEYDIDEDYTNADGTIEKPVLFDCMFDSEMQTELDLGIYVYDYNAYLQKTIGDLYISVDIIVPYNYERLQSKGDKRTVKLAHEIINTICNNPVSKDKNIEWFNELGDVNFTFNRITNGRLSQKNNSVRRTIIFNTTINKHTLVR